MLVCCCYLCEPETNKPKTSITPPPSNRKHQLLRIHYETNNFKFNFQNIETKVNPIRIIFKRSKYFQVQYRNNYFQSAMRVLSFLATFAGAAAVNAPKMHARDSSDQAIQPLDASSCAAVFSNAPAAPMVMTFQDAETQQNYNVSMNIQYALTQNQQHCGLMHRASMPANDGMVHRFSFFLT